MRMIKKKEKVAMVRMEAIGAVVEAGGEEEAISMTITNPREVTQIKNPNTSQKVEQLFMLYYKYFKYIMNSSNDRNQN